VSVGFKYGREVAGAVFLTCKEEMLMGLFRSFQKSEEPLSEFLDSLQVGEPWKLDEKKGGMVVPILRKTTVQGRRDYVVLEEVRDKVRIRDLGSIDKVQMRSSGGKPVFVRGGGVLSGMSTQSRGIQFGVVVVPDRVQEVPVRCVHASRGIVMGDSLTLHSYAPSEVAKALQSKGQHLTWSYVSRWTRRADRAFASEGVDRFNVEPTMLFSTRCCESDNLVRAVDRFQSRVDESLKKIPGDLPDQVGLAILSGGNVVGVEAFDDPASWLALSRSVVRQYEDVLDKEDSGNWSVNQDELVQKIKGFFERAKKGKPEEVFRNSASRTMLIKGEGIMGECTFLRDRPIHFLLTNNAEFE